jgi:hypothetical protein
MNVYGGATVTATQCEFMENGVDGVFCADANTKARLNDCMVHHNGRDGLTACDRAVVDLHGVQKWTSIPTVRMVFMQPVVAK